jgi:light-regulated signal transduction histidine kinase (bacteriophytochrome)
MKNVLSDLEFSIKESSAKIKVGPLPTLFINPFQIHQILQNLISNAIKFRPRDKKDGPIIDVSATEHADHVVLSVKDNGIGIDPQYQDKVFRIFQRLHSRQVYPGTGIGLASCKKVIEHLGGKIWFESKPHHGTTFFVSLPIPNKQRKST